MSGFRLDSFTSIPLYIRIADIDCERYMSSRSLMIAYWMFKPFCSRLCQYPWVEAYKNFAYLAICWYQYHAPQHHATVGSFFGSCILIFEIYLLMFLVLRNHHRGPVGLLFWHIRREIARTEALAAYKSNILFVLAILLYIPPASLHDEPNNRGRISRIRNIVACSGHAKLDRSRINI